MVEASTVAMPRFREEIVKKMISDYERKTPKTKKTYLKACRRIPLGISHFLRWQRPYPLFIDEAKGSRVWDLDGNEYVDYTVTMGLGILGHNHPAIRKATVRVLDKFGAHCGLSTELEVKWAEKIHQHFSSCEKVKAANSGTEAAMLAIRVARGRTGRKKVIKFQGHYHGWSDSIFFDAYSAGIGDMISNGIPHECFSNLIAIPPNDLGALEKAILENKENVAAVIMEPLGQTTGSVPLREGFQKEVREMTEKHGILLIFDEVVTGFRVSIGGAQKVLGVRPDLTAFGKIVGGGFPIGAVGGTDEVMDNLFGVLDSSSENFGPTRVYSPGTFCGNPLSMAGGIAAITELEKGNYIEKANSMAKKITMKINELAEGMKIGLSSFNTYSAFHFEVKTGGDEEADLSRKLEVVDFDYWMRMGLANFNPGLLFLPMHGFTSGVHTKEDLDETMSAFRNVFELLK
jgi:glutamate-1-semialdehyde 2,1-aminomutase